MKVLATGLLAFAAVLYVISVAVGDHGWVSYLRAGSEAAMVGGLADWFAVTALFRRPLGLPIPHTALIPRQKDALAGQLGTFVTEHFLTAEAIHERVKLADPARKAGALLGVPGKAEKLAREIATISADALDAIDPHDLTESGSLSSYIYPTGWLKTTASSRALSVAHGYRYCFSVRSRDRSGNTSAWTAERCIMVK